MKKTFKTLVAASWANLSTPDRIAHTEAEAAVAASATDETMAYGEAYATQAFYNDLVSIAAHQRGGMTEIVLESDVDGDEELARLDGVREINIGALFFKIGLELGAEHGRQRAA